MSFRARLHKLEGGSLIDAREVLHPDLSPLIGSPYTHEDFIELLAREAASKGQGNGNA